MSCILSIPNPISPPSLFFFCQNPRCKDQTRTHLLFMCFWGERRLGSGWGARGLMERDEGKFFYCSSFIACEQAPLFGQAKRASRKCANEGPFPCLLARLASLGLRSKRVQSSYCAKVRADPLPRHSFFFCSRPSFLDEPREETLVTQATLHSPK